MKISLKWLNDYVDVKDYFRKPEELGEILTQAGLEVEEVKIQGKDLNHVVIGVILEKDKHPNADKLSLCRVATGEGVVHQIVCGAQNHKANDRVIVALPGAVLPGNFAIKQAAVRGVESGGMLCSYKELGLAETSDGIAILPQDAPIGTPYAEWAGLDDVTFELKVTPNRADCLSHYGLAREIGTLLKRELKIINPVFKLAEESTKKAIKLEVKAVDLCPRYTGRYIRGIKVEKSPDWLVRRLESVGLNSINNVVDVTNYVMMELGQPLHAFDAAKIAEATVIVDRAPAGEKFTTLDNTEIKMNGGELTIRDPKKSLCVAGVIGSNNSGVTETTTDIFLESAYFSPSSVRKTSRGLGVDTDSAYRFSRGVDPDGAIRALDRATELLIQVTGGEAYADHHDFYPEPIKKSPFPADVQTVTDRLGFQANEAKFVDYMKRLGCELESLGGGKYNVKAPSFRVDMEHEMDLVEEYARLEGYHNIPETLPVFAEVPAQNDKNFILQQKVSESIRADGFHQAFNFSFVSAKGQKTFIKDYNSLNVAGLQATEEEIGLKNPLSEELSVMRSCLSFGLYRNALNNFHHGNEWGRLFEIGTTFYKKEAGYGENKRLGLIAWGKPENLWTKNIQAPLVFDLKSAMENLLSRMHISAYTWLTPKDRGEFVGFAHRGQFAQLIVEGKKVGFVATLNPAILDEDKVRVPVAVGEFDLDQLFQGQPRPFRAESISKMPMVQRDFAFVMPKTLKVGDIMKEIKKLVGAPLVRTDVFDLYEGEKLEPGKKSVAFRIVLQDRNGTLQDAQLNDIQNKVIEGLKSQFNISIR
jgi:phenylalanyl-tRNA synthetase beta chain